MIERLTDFLREKNYIFKEFKDIAPKELGSRKKIKIFNCIDLKDHYISVFYITQSSRFLLKNSKELEMLQKRLVQTQEHNFKKNIVFIQAPLCSKAKKYLEEIKWSIYHDTL